VFLFGDLNFRIELPNEVVRAALAKESIESIAFLKKHDELLSLWQLFGEEFNQDKADLV
jgi:hypothetical protein